MSDPEGIHNGLLGRTNLRTVLLAAICAVAMAMLWWMYAEQAKIHELSKMRAVPTGQGTPREGLHITLEATRPNITNIIVQEKKENELQWDYNWDLQQWADPAEAKGVGVRTIFLVRHGQYDFSTGLLTDIGKQQANLTGLRLKEMGPKFSRIVHSTMDRARETAECIHKYFPGVPMQSDDMLQEGGPVPPKPTVTYWGLSDRQYFVEGPRLESAFRKYIHRAEKSQAEHTHELLVGHGNIFRYFVLRALQLESSAWMRVFIAHASITILHINPDSTVTMTRFGDSGHFPNAMVTI